MQIAEILKLGKLLRKSMIISKKNVCNSVLVNVNKMHSTGNIFLKIFYNFKKIVLAQYLNYWLLCLIQEL